jgi:hypothetical protein
MKLRRYRAAGVEWTANARESHHDAMVEDMVSVVVFCDEPGDARPWTSRVWIERRCCTQHHTTLRAAQRSVVAFARRYILGCS